MLSISPESCFHFKTLDSTNLKAKALLESEQTPFIVTAEIQTLGRGRLSNQWDSQLGGLYFTLTLNTKDYSYEVQHYPFLISLSVFDLLSKHISSGLRLKWPNDVMVDRKKICGILIEQIESHLVIGIGINVNQREAPETAISLQQINQIHYDLNELASDLKQSLSSVFDKYEMSHAAIYSDVVKLYINLNEMISCRVAGKQIDGVFEGLGDHGELLLKTDTGIERIYAAEIIESGE